MATFKSWTKCINLYQWNTSRWQIYKFKKGAFLSVQVGGWGWIGLRLKIERKAAWVIWAVLLNDSTIHTVIRARWYLTRDMLGTEHTDPGVCWGVRLFKCLHDQLHAGSELLSRHRVLGQRLTPTTTKKAHCLVRARIWITSVQEWPTVQSPRHKVGVEQ